MDEEGDKLIDIESFTRDICRKVPGILFSALSFLVEELSRYVGGS